jgi:hypothetical protein
MKWESWLKSFENVEDGTNNRVLERNESEQSDGKEEGNNAREREKEDIELQRAVRLA